jgi:hypothetical protein
MTGPKLLHSVTPEQSWTFRGTLFMAMKPVETVDSETDGSIQIEAWKPAKEPETCTKGILSKAVVLLRGGGNGAL